MWNNKSFVMRLHVTFQLFRHFWALFIVREKLRFRCKYLSSMQLLTLKRFPNPQTIFRLTVKTHAPILKPSFVSLHPRWFSLSCPRISALTHEHWNSFIPLVLAHYWYQFPHSYFDHDHPPDTFKRFPLFWVHTSKRFDWKNRKKCTQATLGALSNDSPFRPIFLWL